MKNLLNKIKYKFLNPEPRFSQINSIEEQSVFKKVKKIEIKAKSLLDVSLLGNYQTTFRGKGLEFDRVREYQDSDEEKTIDWNVTARTGKFHVKSYTEERELNLFFLIDISASSLFGIEQNNYRKIAAEICCCLALNAVKNNDRIGLALFSKKIEKFMKAKKGRNHLLAMIQQILIYKNQSRKTNIAKSLEQLEPYLKKKSILFLISDFLDNSDYKNVLKRIRQKQEILIIHLENSLQEFLNHSLLLQVQDMETGRIKTINSYENHNIDKKLAKENYQNQDFNKFFKKQKIPTITINCQKNYYKELLKFFKNNNTFGI